MSVELAYAIPAFLLGALTVLAHDRWRHLQAARTPRHLRRPGFYRCQGRCGYRFRHDGAGRWVGPYGSAITPSAMSWTELEDAYGDCTRNLTPLTTRSEP